MDNLQNNLQHIQEIALDVGKRWERLSNRHTLGSNLINVAYSCSDLDYYIIYRIKLSGEHNNIRPTTSLIARLIQNVICITIVLCLTK